MRIGHALLSALVLTGALSLDRPASAASNGTCLLEVGGRTFIDGPCEIDLESDGSFVVRSLRGGEVDYFAYVLMDGGNRATGYWNEEPGASHAHSPLGTLARDGACWENETAKVCAWG